MYPLEWVKKNKLIAVVLVVLAYVLFSGKPVNVPFLSSNTASRQYSESYMGMGAPATGGGIMDLSLSSKGYQPMPQNESVNLDTTDRKVVQESSVSLKVKDVNESLKIIKNKAEQVGGFMVNSYLDRPEESASGNISIRVPEAKLEEVLDFVKTNALKVVSQNLDGRDVTDQYTDITERLATLLTTKAKFEEIMTNAKTVSEILEVQRELTNLQYQIDSLKGQQMYLDKTTSSVLIRVYLAEDEFSLPYAPSTSWRPNVIFKLAVRSLVTTFRDLGERAIWLAVYSVLWVPALVIFIVVKKRFFSSPKK